MQTLICVIKGRLRPGLKITVRPGLLGEIYLLASPEIVLLKDTALKVY